MKIYIKKIKPEEIEFLQDNHTLYTCDFRSISENMEYVIPEMWKYENLLGWILKGKNIAANEDYKKLKYPFSNNFYEFKKGSDPRISIYKKILTPNKNIEKLWVAIPHPIADELAKDNNLQLNYSYSDFLLRNDKIKQKKLLKDLTPEWKIIGKDDFFKLKETKGFIKRKLGSGGFTVFDVKKLKNVNKDLLKDDEWYFEKFVNGKSYSIQCLADKNSDITIFGFSQQIIINKTNFSGSKILNIEKLDNKTIEALKKGIQKIGPLLKNYVGFFGIDFIMNKNTVQILEANIRMTAATIPTLLTNMCACDNAVYHEDIEDNKDRSIIISLDKNNNQNLVDKIELLPTKNSFGKYAYISIKNVKSEIPQINKKGVDYLSDIISSNVSPVVKADFFNFWPHGWTVSLILKDSHCVLSSWFIEKTIQIDIFSCNSNFSEKGVAKILKDYFDGEIKKITCKIR